MRLHRLDITAFGPFATSVSVDLDALSQAGLFLLSGATGAGKTSVLDAVCFALYGDVPGDRSSAKRLRCDQAAPGVAPRVELEATLAGRRFRLTRSPSWDRPKRRGTGTTTAPAQVSISERIDDAWVPLTSRLDEAGDLVGRLLGMSLTQFTQVALLPQGRFQTFLRARSEERHRLLQRLFRTGRFEQVELWLRERRSALARRHATQHDLVADLVSRASEAADTAPPEAWDLHDLAPEAADGALLAWVDELLDHARESLATAAGRVEAAEGTERATRAALQTARAAAERRERLDAARAERSRLHERAADHASDVAALARARAAAAVLPWGRLAETARVTARRATEDAVRATQEARTRVEGDLAAAADAALDAAAVARAAVPRAARRDTVHQRLLTLRPERAALTLELDEHRTATAEMPARLASARERLQSAQRAVEQEPPLLTALEAATARCRAHADVTVAMPRLESARSDWLDARRVAVDLHDELLELQQARLEGMAAELAGRLVVGADCPVCGSHDHPHKAGALPGAPDAAAERGARSRLDDARVVEHAHEVKVRDLETSLALARERAGAGGQEEAERERDALRQQLAHVVATARGLPEAEQALADLEAERARLERVASELATAAATADAELAALDAECERLAAELVDVLAGHTSLEAAIAHHTEVERSARSALRRAAEAEAATRSAAEAEADLHRAATEAGFPSGEQALAAALSPPEVDALTAQIAEHERRWAAVVAILDDADAADEAAPDVETAEAEHATALDELGVAGSRRQRYDARSTRLAGLRGSLAEALDRWTPLREELEVATALSAFVDGRSTDNALRMRLSAYVLAYRLSQVVDAANERLSRMSDQRYRLEHTGHRGAGETRGGLSLLVRDDWTGDARDPATLSGGETFVVSLALALGLADVIAHESGGAALDTLFVDEGFGALDADTLDDVMDTLDALRDGGRVVGVVSHVAEMRDRIPTQLVVTKSRSGSTLAVRR